MEKKAIREEKVKRKSLYRGDLPATANPSEANPSGQEESGESRGQTRIRNAEEISPKTPNFGRSTTTETMN